MIFLPYQLIDFVELSALNHRCMWDMCDVNIIFCSIIITVVVKIWHLY